MCVSCSLAMIIMSNGILAVRQPFATLLHHSLQDAVAVVGYPIGGDTISVTSGVVSRIEVTSYVHGSTELLGVQIDAAINSGNSGEHCPYVMYQTFSSCSQQRSHANIIYACGIEAF